jgi:hypothetical protein
VLQVFGCFSTSGRSLIFHGRTGGEGVKAGALIFPLSSSYLGIGRGLNVEHPVREDRNLSVWHDGTVEEADDEAGDSPLDEVGCGLL